MDCQLPLQFYEATETDNIEYLASHAVDVQDRLWTGNEEIKESES